MTRKPYPSEMADTFNVRLPTGMRDAIRQAAAASHRSMNSEIVFHLEKAMAATGEGLANTAPAAASSNNAALAGGASINR